MQKKTFYLIGSLFFIAVIIGYHFFAASQAEQQIDEAIQKQSQKSGNLSVQYSDIEVTPFSADVIIRDLTLIMGDHIERAHSIHVDLAYLDFLNIYLGGPEYGLRQLESAFITAVHPSYINKSGREEIKADTLRITYHGNALDGLKSSISGVPFNSDHMIEIQGRNVTVSLPQTTFSRVKAHAAQYSGSLSKSKSNFWKHGTHHLQLDSLVWTPSQSFQNRYSFFIKGFGYETDAIPFESAELNIAPAPEPGLVRIEGSLESKLATFAANGRLEIQEPLASSGWQQMEISMGDFSDTFSNVLTNLERMLSISLPKQNGRVQLQLEGTVSSTNITQK